MTGESVAFVRKASGLRREVSLLDAVTLNMSSMGGGAALGTIGFTMVLLPSVSGVNLVYGSLIAWLLSIPQVIVYKMMSTRMSRTGGDYVWVSRVFGGFFGGPFALMGFVFETFAYLGLIALAAVSAIGSVGVSLGYQNMLSLALPGNVPGSDQMLQFVIGALIFTVLVVINIIKPRIGFKIVSTLTIVGALAVFVAILVLVGAGQQGVVNYMNTLNTMGANTTYTQVASSYSGPTFDFGASIFLVPFFAVFAYPWLNAGPAVASEIKGKSAIEWNVVISSVVTFLVITAAFGTLYYVGGLGFINAALANPSLVYNYSFNFWTLAMGVSNNVAVAGFLGLGWIVWNLTILAYGIIVISRYLFAGAFDRFLPEKISYVSPKYSSPVVAYMIELVAVIIMIGGASFLYGTFVSLYGAVIAGMVYFLVVGLAAVVYALKKERGQSKAILSIAGLLMVIVFAYIIYQFLASPAIWGGNLFAYGYVVGSFVLGAIIYAISKAYYSKRGIDITLAYKELPPL
jgi:amino acid transporter